MSAISDDLTRLAQILAVVDTYSGPLGIVTIYADERTEFAGELAKALLIKETR